jgi:hypothetical protein
VPSDLLELVVVERAGLGEDLLRDRELADVVEEPAGGEVPELDRRQAERLAEPDGEQRHAARMPLGVRVLLRELLEQRVDVAAEVRLLGDDEVDAAQVAEQRTRLRLAAQVERHRDADQRDPDDLEEVAEPPAELRVVEHERADEGGAEPDRPDGDEQVGAPAAEQERPRRAKGEEGEERESEDEQGVGGRRRGLRHVRDQGGSGEADRAERDDAGHEDDLEGEQEPDPERAAQPGQGRER